MTDFIPNYIHSDSNPLLYGHFYSQHDKKCEVLRQGWIEAEY